MANLSPAPDPVRRDICRQIHQWLEEQAPGATDAAQLISMLSRPPEAALGDFALPCFPFARSLRRKPDDIAADLQAALTDQGSPWVARWEVKGAFLNLFLNHGAVAGWLLPQIRDGALFKILREQSGLQEQKVMVEYSQPNTHKTFHVGHMRNVALGDCLSRLYRYCGYGRVIPVNYIGDEGTHIAKCLWHIRRTGKTPPDAYRGEWLGDMYAEAGNVLADATPEEREEMDREISAVLSAIESREGEIYELWQETRQWSVDVFHEIYDWLGAEFEYDFFESEVSEESQAIVDEFLDKGVFVHSEGAVGIDLKDKKAGFCIFRKSDGNTTYAAKDLALARRKYEKYDVDRSVYVVGSEQILHFRQVFLTLERMGFDQAKDCYHLSYAHVVGPEGRMASRKGTAIAFSDLREKLTEALGEKLERYKDDPDWSEADIAQTNRLLGIGAIRYGMLCSDPAKEITFELDRWLEFSGDTGPYLMYSYARSRSILKNAAEQGHRADPGAAPLLATDEEQEILRWMFDFNDTVAGALQAKKPSMLTHYLFDMCKSFSRFHKNVSVLKAGSAELAAARLALVEAFSLVLKNGLGLLGITPPERM